MHLTLIFFFHSSKINVTDHFDRMPETRECEFSSLELQLSFNSRFIDITNGRGIFVESLLHIFSYFNYLMLFFLANNTDVLNLKFNLFRHVNKRKYERSYFY